MKKGNRISGIFALVLIFGTMACGMHSFLPENDIGSRALDWPISAIHMENLELWMVLNRLTIRMPELYFELLPRNPKTDPRITLDMKNTTGRQVIQAILSQDPRYAHVTDNGYVVIAPKSALKDPGYLLNIKIDRISVKNVRLTEIDRIITAWLVDKKKMAHALVFDSGVMLGGDEPVITLDLSNKTIRSVLLEAAKQRRVSLEVHVEGDGAHFQANSWPSQAIADEQYK